MIFCKSSQKGMNGVLLAPCKYYANECDNKKRTAQILRNPCKGFIMR